MKLALDINPQWFLDNLIAGAAIAGGPLSNVLQKLTIDGIKDKLQPLLEEGLILSIEANGFFKGSCASLKETVEKQGFIFEHFRFKIETPLSIVIEEQDVLLPANLKWLPKDGYEDFIFTYRKIPLKKKNRYFIEIYNLLIPATLIQPVYDKFLLTCSCSHRDLAPVHAKAWVWWIEFGCKVCGKTYFCDCFRPALEKFKSVALEQASLYADAGWPYDFLGAVKRAEFRPNICHLCTGSKSEMTFCHSMYGSDVMVNYGAYVRKISIEHNIAEQDAENIVRDRLGLSYAKKLDNITTGNDTLASKDSKCAEQPLTDSELGESTGATFHSNLKESAERLDSHTTAAEYWQLSRDALSNNEIDKAVQLAFQARKKEAEIKGHDFLANTPFGNPLGAKRAVLAAKILDIPITGLSDDTKAELRNEIAFGILKGENPRVAEKRLRAILKDDSRPDLEEMSDNFLTQGLYNKAYRSAAVV